MRFGVVGADKETGNDVEVVLTAATQAEAEELAHNRGILVSGIKLVAEPEGDAIALVDDDDPDEKPGTVTGVALADGSVAGASRAPEAKSARSSAGTITVNASAPSDTAHTGAGHIPTADHSATAMEYHILMNQSLYLLETAVNKQLRDGWEPAGGIGIGISNNAQVFYQAVTRRRK
ncbi:MAG: hypothetical protein ACTHN5_12610 [Phycisphaerae bacterium]